MNIHFYKYQGTGNDFVITDNRNGLFNNLTTAQVKKICDRRFGIGADGFMLLNTREGYDFEMKYYNSDGAESSMCGNGGRCLVRFARDRGIIKPLYRFMAIDGEHEATFDDQDWVRLKMKDVEGVDTFNSDFVLDTGSPHYVKVVDEVSTVDVFNAGRNIRNNEAFSKAGINVNFVSKSTEGLQVRTYERGVEDETLSCGTGVTAAALAAADSKEGYNRIAITAPGGKLAVEFNKIDKQTFNNIWLCGPATFVFEGDILV